MINCSTKLKQQLWAREHCEPKTRHPVFLVSRWVPDINLELRHAAARQMCEFWYCGRGAMWLSSPVVRLFTRPRGQKGDHTDHKTQLHKHCQRGWVQQRTPSALSQGLEEEDNFTDKDRDAHWALYSIPPTSLSVLKLLKPFELRWKCSNINSLLLFSSHFILKVLNQDFRQVTPWQSVLRSGTLQLLKSYKCLNHFFSVVNRTNEM